MLTASNMSLTKQTSSQISHTGTPSGTGSLIRPCVVTTPYSYLCYPYHSPQPGSDDLSGLSANMREHISVIIKQNNELGLFDLSTSTSDLVNTVHQLAQDRTRVENEGERSSLRVPA